MNIAEDLLRKEVIDDSGIVMGVVKDVTWDFVNNRVESLVVEKGGNLLSSGEKKYVSYENIHSIGDKVLVNIKFSPTKEETEDEDEFGLNRFRLKF